MTGGKLKTSAILVATENKTKVYRTIQEMPFSLRRKIVRLASGPNTGTLLIADRRGVREWLASQGRGAAIERPARPSTPWGVRLWLALSGAGLLAVLLWAFGVFRL